MRNYKRLKRNRLKARREATVFDTTITEAELFQRVKVEVETKLTVWEWIVGLFRKLVQG